jgi:Flp pilus assembly protein TadD
MQIAALNSIHNPKPDVQAELAYTYQLDGKPSESATLYAQAADALPRDLSLQLAAAEAQIAAGSTAKANNFLTRVAAIDSRNYRLHAILGEIAQLQERESRCGQPIRRGAYEIYRRIPQRGLSTEFSCT